MAALGLTYTVPGALVHSPRSSSFLGGQRPHRGLGETGRERGTAGSYCAVPLAGAVDSRVPLSWFPQAPQMTEDHKLDSVTQQEIHSPAVLGLPRLC